MKSILQYIHEKGGYATLKELKRSSFYTREIAKLLKEGKIEKVKPGLYRLADIPVNVAFKESLIDVCHAIPDAVVCLISALDFHGLTTFNPSKISVAIPHSNKPPKIEYPPVKIFYFRERFYSPGIITQRTSAGMVRVYSREKTICDMFRYRKKLGEDLAVEGLKTYLRSKKVNLKLLQDYAVKCQVKTVMLPYLRAIVG